MGFDFSVPLHCSMGCVYLPSLGTLYIRSFPWGQSGDIMEKSTWNKRATATGKKKLGKVKEGENQRQGTQN